MNSNIHFVELRNVPGFELNSNIKGIEAKEVGFMRLLDEIKFTGKWLECRTLQHNTTKFLDSIIRF